ncbi:MAG: FoF1 ATP synthase subunit gamma [Pirellulaceae bacterium]
MKREQTLRRRLHSLRTLHDAVGAMRSLSAHHFRLLRKSLPEARGYREQMQQIVAEVGLHQRMHGRAPNGLLVVASDLGLCGDYNSRLAEATLRQRDEHGAGPLYSVGRRIRGTLSRFGIAPSRSYATPASAQALVHLLLPLAQDILQDYAAGRMSRLFVVSARFEGVGHFAPVSTLVLPIAPVAASHPLRRSPYVDPAHLAAVVVREYLYITLYEILLDALAAEHGMRLLAAEAAFNWLDETSERTGRRLSVCRSEAATQELLDIVAGGALRRAESQSARAGPI